MKVGMCAVIAAVASLGACSPTSVEGAQASAASKSPAHEAKEQATQGTTLAAALAEFTSPNGRAWKGYLTIPGITWLHTDPSEYTEGHYEQSGRLLLAGFGPAKIPNGKSGADYETAEGNEGQSGITLNGTREEVRLLSVKKFYFSDDYQAILRRQFVNEPVVILASGCNPENEDGFVSNPSFFEISLKQGGVVYVEAFLEDGGKYSPGYTVFDFSREKPVDRMKELSCAIR